MQPVGPPADGFLTYRTTFVPPDSGRYAVTVRATPYHPELIHPYEIGLIRWLGVDSDAVSASGKRLGRPMAAAASGGRGGKEAGGGSPAA